MDTSDKSSPYQYITNQRLRTG